MLLFYFFFFFEQKTSYEMRISDWSSDVCSSDLRFGRLESGTAMGVVFSIMFAGGVLLMEQAAASNIDLDAECVLYGQLEDILWLAPTGLASLLDPEFGRAACRESVCQYV